MWDWIIFLFGALGAIAPEVIRLYKARTKGIRISNWVFYSSITIAFIGTAGVLANVLGARSTYGSFYVGLTWPTLVSTMLSKKPAQTTSLGLVAPQTTTGDEARTWREVLWIIIA